MTQGETMPPQHQDRQPGIEAEMTPRPIAEDQQYRGSGKLQGKVALITGGDSGIGRAVAIMYAREGADVAIVYLNEHEDAEETKRLVEKEGRRCHLIAGDIGSEQFCQQAVQQTVGQLGKLDILVNNAAEQHPQDSIEQISAEQLERTFRTNIFAMFYLTKAALPHLGEGSAIINTGSVNGLRGNKTLIDYSASKGGIHVLTMALAQALVDRKIRVNCVAPGPVWTPLIPATMGGQKAAKFGQQTPMNEAAQPDEIAPSYVFFAAERLSSYYSGEVLAPIGGETLPG